MLGRLLKNERLVAVLQNMRLQSMCSRRRPAVAHVCAWVGINKIGNARHRAPGPGWASIARQANDTRLFMLLYCFNQGHPVTAPTVGTVEAQAHSSPCAGGSNAHCCFFTFRYMQAGCYRICMCWCLTTNCTGNRSRHRDGRSALARDIKKPAEGAAGKTTSRKWRERKTEIDYRTGSSRSLGLLQLLTRGTAMTALVLKLSARSEPLSGPCRHVFQPDGDCGIFAR